MLKEFKEFALKGNMVDLAVGMIIGSAFTSIVNSLVNDIVMPIIGMLFGKIDFTSLRIILTPATEDTAEAAIRYGAFIQAIVNFLLVAFVIFSVVKAINKMRRQKEEEPAPEPEPEPEPAPSDEVVLLSEIRDLLKKQ